MWKTTGEVLVIIEFKTLSLLFWSIWSIYRCWINRSI